MAVKLCHDGGLLVAMPTTMHGAAQSKAGRGWQEGVGQQDTEYAHQSEESDADAADSAHPRGKAVCK